MTQINASMSFDTRKMEEAITEAVLAKVLPGIAQTLADVQRLTKLLEAEAVEPAEMSAVLAHSGAVSLEVAQAQAQSLTRLGYRLMPVAASSAPETVAATWAGPTPPQAAPALRPPTGEVPVIGAGQGPLWTPPEVPESPAAQLGRDLDAMVDQARRDHPQPGDKDWLGAFE